MYIRKEWKFFKIIYRNDSRHLFVVIRPCDLFMTIYQSKNDNFRLDTPNLAKYLNYENKVYRAFLKSILRFVAESNYF